MFQKCLDNEEETADANSRATHQVPLVPQEQSSGVGLSRLSSNSVCDSFLTAGENASENRKRLRNSRLLCQIVLDVPEGLMNGMMDLVNCHECFIRRDK